MSAFPRVERVERVRAIAVSEPGSSARGVPVFDWRLDVFFEEFEREGTGRCAEDSTSSRFMVFSGAVSSCAGSGASAGNSSSSRARFLPLLFSFSPFVLLDAVVGLLSS